MTTGPEKSCHACAYSRELFMADWKPPKYDLRCFRLRTMRGGNVEHPLGVGASCSFEADSLPEPQRVENDKCGHLRKHWLSAK
jgi:hypothetical protein